jgi:hypothetical protein
MAINPKFQRQYEWSRKLAKEPAGDNYKALLNTLYYVYPIAFEKPDFQEEIRKKYAPHITKFDLFSLNMARLFRRSDAIKIAICCMPKSGSTYLLTSLKRVKELEFQTIYLQTPYMNIDFIEALSREHEVDELSLLIHEMRGFNWVSHMHTKWTPYTEKIFKANKIKPVVTFRNIFDCLVSMDDMLMSGEVAGFPMIRLPGNYRRLAEAERLAFLTDYVGSWYLDYVVSWSRAGMDTLKLHYEDDILGFDLSTATKIRDFIGKGLSLDTIIDAFQLADEKAKRSARVNKGISGRGEKIPQAARERLKGLTWPYRDEVDFSKVL